MLMHVNTEGEHLHNNTVLRKNHMPGAWSFSKDA